MQYSIRGKEHTAPTIFLIHKGNDRQDTHIETTLYTRIILHV